jgi:hypothetical protein
VAWRVDGRCASYTEACLVAAECRRTAPASPAHHPGPSLLHVVRILKAPRQRITQYCTDCSAMPMRVRPGPRRPRGGAPAIATNESISSASDQMPRVDRTQAIRSQAHGLDRSPAPCRSKCRHCRTSPGSSNAALVLLRMLQQRFCDRARGSTICSSARRKISRGRNVPIHSRIISLLMSWWGRRE